MDEISNIINIYCRENSIINQIPQKIINRKSYVIIDRPDILKYVIDINIENKFDLIYLQIEPENIVPQENIILFYKNDITTIYTYNKYILDNCQNSIKYIYGTTWISEEYYENIDIHKKQFKISTIAGLNLY